ncbi:hypothetical protein M3P21_08745 [Ruegeria sp. 2012CJ41-6]|uniref:Uncharacterized protein n=1 Tax=Ruegeria spongiae TaxID=2942209 RepID=A0ABT0Q1A6_9RHOB|nr:hypothetical protein [Ruegeria spongiae]MCL6283620.1 hypothetical protein [Ruegeria spongiae]
MCEFDLWSSFFSRTDLVEVLDFPAETIFGAWDALVPHFGSLQPHGFLRSTAAPNFFDVISITAHCSLSRFMVDQSWAKNLSLSVSDLLAALIDEVSLVLREEFSDFLGFRYYLKFHDNLVDCFELWANDYPCLQRMQMLDAISRSVRVVMRKIRARAIQYAIVNAPQSK